MPGDAAARGVRRRRLRPPALWKGLAELGCAGLALPEEHGGAGLELLECALAAEVLGAGAFPGPFLGHTMAGLAIQLAGSDAQRRRWLPALASGELIGTVAFGEPGERWLPESWTARLEGGRLSGAKTSVPHAERAQLAVVGTAGGGLALLDTGAATVLPVDALDRTQPIASLRFAEAPAEALPNGVAAAPRVVDAGLALLAADALGAAWRMIELTRDYTLARKQFGQPLAQFPSVKHQLANLVTDTEPCRALVWFAAHALDHRVAESPKASASTQPGAAKHAGISYLLVPMKQPGVRVAPLRQMNGGAELYEVTFDGARTAADNLLGQRGEGWKVSRSTLVHERKLIGDPNYIRRLFNGVVELARRTERGGRPALDVRRRLSRLEGYLLAQEYTNLRQLTASAKGEFMKVMAAMLVTKLHSTNLTMTLTALAVDLTGEEALVMPTDEEAQGYTIPKLTAGTWLSHSMFTIAISIAGGASNIQRNIIGERLLGLPRDLRAGS